MSIPDSTANNEIASAFVEQHQSEVIGVLHGWDRLRLQGTLRSLYYQPVMEEYLWQSKVLWKDFKRFATELTGRVRGAAEKLAVGQRRPMIYLPSSRTRKEEVARQIQQRDKVRRGLIAVLSCVEPATPGFCGGIDRRKSSNLSFSGVSACTCIFIGCMRIWAFCICGFRAGFRF
jgi:hypothetical protein